MFFICLNLSLYRIDLNQVELIQPCRLHSSYFYVHCCLVKLVSLLLSAFQQGSSLALLWLRDCFNFFFSRNAHRKAIASSLCFVTGEVLNIKHIKLFKVSCNITGSSLFVALYINHAMCCLETMFPNSDYGTFPFEGPS